MKRRSRLRRLSPRVAAGAAALVFLGSTSARGDPRALDAAVAKARALGLARSTAWDRLVHYRPGFWGGPVSEIDGAAFFVSPRGKEDPEAELEATLAAFFAPIVPGREDAHALCRFPARRRWLDGRLGFEGAMRSPRCPALGGFRAAIDATAVSLVYASSYLGNPGSALGHTFLRFARRRGAAEETPSERLDVAVEYVVATDTKNPLLYAAKGVAGLFPQRIELRTFEHKARQYGRSKDRDLWEYRLALTGAEVETLVEHLWELTTTHVDYFYMTENCAYHVVALLEAAAPRIDVISGANAVVIPTDTVKALVDLPGLVTDVAYHPSERSRERRGGPPPPPAPRDEAPDRGHRSLRATLGAGATTQHRTPFAALGFRFAFHDLADPPGGGPELLHLQFLDALLRYRPADGSLSLDRLTFAELVAIHPLTRRDMSLSWRFRGAGLRLHDRGCGDCFAQGPNLSVGGAIATDDEHALLFVMADASVLVAPDLAGIGGSFVRVGIGPHAGLRLRLPGDAIAVASGSWSFLPAQEPAGTYDLRAVLRGAIAPDLALGIEAAMQPSSLEAQIGTYLYF